MTVRPPPARHWRSYGNDQLPALATASPPPVRSMALVGQIAATVGLTVLEEAGMAMWDQLKSLGLVEYGEQFIVKGHPRRRPTLNVIASSYEATVNRSRLEPQCDLTLKLGD
jgi:hypothetical protein